MVTNHLFYDVHDIKHLKTCPLQNHALTMCQTDGENGTLSSCMQ